MVFSPLVTHASQTLVLLFHFFIFLLFLLFQAQFIWTHLLWPFTLSTQRATYGFSICSYCFRVLNMENIIML